MKVKEREWWSMRRAKRAYPSLEDWLQLTRALRSRPFTLLWTGQTISVLGDAVFTIAITWEVLLLTGSATAIRLILIAQWAPKILFLLFVGLFPHLISQPLLILLTHAA